MPDDIAILGLVVGPLATAHGAGLYVLRIGRPVVQMGSANLDIPADGIDHQGQHPGVIDQIQKGLVLG